MAEPLGEENSSAGRGGKLAATFMLLAFLGFALVMGGLIGKDVLATFATYFWTKTPCRILSSEVVSSSNNKPYRLNIQYQYNVNGRTFHSTQFARQPVTYKDYREAAEMAQRWVSGSRSVCFVNPVQPEVAVLQRSSLWMGAAMIFPLVFLAISVGGIFMIWKRKAPDRNPRPVSERAEARPAARVASGCTLFVFFSIFFIAGCIAFFFTFIKPLIKVAQAKSWSESTCVIVSSSVNSSRGRKSSSYYPNILFEYAVGGKDYKSSQVHFFQGVQSSRKLAQKWTGMFRAGAMAKCYLNPSDPSEAVLVRDLVPEMWLGLFPLLFIALGAGGMAFGLRTRSRAQALTRNAGTFAGLRGTENSSTLAMSGGAPQSLTLKASASPRGKFLIAIVVCLFWNGIVSVFVWQAISAWRQGGDAMSKWFLPIFLIPFVAIGLALVGAVFYTFLALFNPRPVLNVNRRTLPLGETLQVEWSVPSGAGRIEQLTIELLGREHATYRRGTRNHTDTKVFLTLPVAQAATRLDIQSGQAQVQIPATSMHTFRGRHNSITWVLRLKGAIRQWPDVSDEYEIEVAPAEFRS